MAGMTADEPDVSNACAMAIVAPTIASGVAAFFWAIANGGAAAAPFAVFLALAFFICAFFVAMAHVLLFGLPAFLLLRRIIAPGWLLSGAFGFALGAAPFLLIARMSGTDGLDDVVPIALFLGAMGLIGGLGFRWKLYSSEQAEPS